MPNNDENTLIHLYKKTIETDISTIQEITKEILTKTQNECHDKGELKTETKLLNSLSASLSNNKEYAFPEKIKKHDPTGLSTENIDTIHIFKMLQTMENIYSAATIIQENIEISNQEIKKSISSNLYDALRSLFTKLFSKLKILSKRLWQILSKYCTLQSWSIQGSLNTNSFLGLSGSIQAQLTFGT